jgi:OOP family OmpA-OmpF porin
MLTSITKIVLLLLINCSLLINKGLAQNLVPNPSFEDTITCPWTDDKINYATGWFKPSVSSSDLLHTCSSTVPSNFFGYQNANTGNAYAGLYSYHTVGGVDSNYREYISIKLMDSLMQGEKYDVDFYISRSDSSNYATILGIYFSPDSIYSSSSNNLNFIPQLEETSAIIDKNQWVKLSYQYTANGGEKYINIGNFRQKNLSDTINTADGGDTNNPDYYAAYYFIDDVSVVKDTTTGVNDFYTHEKVTIYPNPVTDYLNINTINETYDLTIFNSLGQVIFMEKNIRDTNKRISTNQFDSGLLFINIKTKNLNLYYKSFKT